MAALAATALAAWAPPALASGPDGAAVEAAEIATEAAAAAVGPETGDVAFRDAPDGESSVVAVSSDVAVAAPLNASEPMVIGTGEDDALDIGISLPAAASAKQAEIVDGDAVYVDKRTDTSFVVDGRNDGARIMSLLNSPGAPTRMTYSLDLPKGFELVARQDGSIDVATVTHDTEVVIATIEAPWAVDAAGVEVGTHYTVSGSDLTQVVELTANTTFPVTADPRVRTRWFGGTVYFTKRETGLLAAGATGCATVAGIAAAASGGLAAPIAAAIGAACGVLLTFATAAQAVGKCVRWNWYGSPARIVAGNLWIGTCD